MKPCFKKFKRFVGVGLIFVLIFSLAGCTLFDSKAKIYSRYITSLLDINYKNVSKDYITLTGVSQKDAEAVYVANMDYQAHNLMHYYGIKEVDDGTILSEFYYLAQSILANAKYEVSKVTEDKESGQYIAEVTIYPLDTLECTYDTVVSYIENFNAKVEEGDYNNATEVEYETEFAEGIIEILKSTTSNPGYMDPVTIQVPIAPTSDYYYIQDEDFLTLDANILFIRENVGSLAPEADEDAEEESDTVTVE
ncbi:MAG: hypothetical protein Q4D51_06600 [Eubacteriales bacterium]|nr:hypothetical protein [Eubacteriales bacterium]